MRLADGIRKRGFRKWYEGELTRSHLRLVLVLLCAVGACRLASSRVPIASAASSSCSPAGSSAPCRCGATCSC